MARPTESLLRRGRLVTRLHACSMRRHMMLRRFQTWSRSPIWSTTLPKTKVKALRYAGYQRSKELLELHRANVQRLALALAERSELDQAAIEQILISNG